MPRPRYVPQSPKTPPQGDEPQGRDRNQARNHPAGDRGCRGAIGPRTPVIYEIVRRHGEDEMARPPSSLWWSGVAAGLSISFSLLAQAILEMHIAGRAVAAAGHELRLCFGFVMAVPPANSSSPKIPSRSSARDGRLVDG